MSAVKIDLSALGAFVAAESEHVGHRRASLFRRTERSPQRERGGVVGVDDGRLDLGARAVLHLRGDRQRNLDGRPRHARGLIAERDDGSAADGGQRDTDAGAQAQSGEALAERCGVAGGRRPRS